MMIPWLDFKIFGNGRGLAQPYFNGIFYWINGNFYIWSGWSLSQLASFQWRIPEQTERRVLCGRNFMPIRFDRRWGRTMVMWGMIDLPDDRTERYQAISGFKKELSNLRY